MDIIVLIEEVEELTEEVIEKIENLEIIMGMREGVTMSMENEEKELVVEEIILIL